MAGGRDCAYGTTLSHRRLGYLRRPRTKLHSFRALTSPCNGVTRRHTARPHQCPLGIRWQAAASSTLTCLWCGAQFRYIRDDVIRRRFNVWGGIQLLQSQDGNHVHFAWGLRSLVRSQLRLHISTSVRYQSCQQRAGCGVLPSNPSPARLDRWRHDAWLAHVPLVDCEQDTANQLQARLEATRVRERLRRTNKQLLGDRSRQRHLCPRMEQSYRHCRLQHACGAYCAQVPGHCLRGRRSEREPIDIRTRGTKQ